MLNVEYPKIVRFTGNNPVMWYGSDYLDLDSSLDETKGMDINE